MRKLDSTFKKMLGWAIRGNEANVKFILELAAIYSDYLVHSITFPSGAEKTTLQKLNVLIIKNIIDPWLQQHDDAWLQVKHGHLVEYSKAFHRLLFEWLPSTFDIEAENKTIVNYTPYHGVPSGLNLREINAHGTLISFKQICQAMQQLDIKPRTMLDKHHYIKIHHQYFYLHNRLDSHELRRDYLAQEMQTGELVVIKQFHYEEGDFCSVIHDFDNEFEVAIALKNTKGALRYRYRDNDTDYLGFSLKNKIEMRDMYLALSLQSGVTLHQLPCKVSEVIWLRRFRGMLLAVKQLHDQNIFHGSLKLANFLFDQEEQVSIIGFRMGGFFSESSDFTNIALSASTYKNVPEYSGFSFTRATEVYVLGLMLVDILKFHINKKRKKIRIPEQYNFNPHRSGLGLSEEVDSQLIALLNQMLLQDPRLRPALANCIKMLDRMIARSVDSVLIYQKIGLIEFKDIYDTHTTVNMDFLPVARSMDQVYIVTDQHKLAHAPVNALQNLLTKLGVKVIGELHALDGTCNSECLLSATHQFKEKNNQHLCVTQYFYITNKNALSLLHSKYFTKHDIIRIYIDSQNPKPNYHNVLNVYPKMSLAHLMLVIKKLGEELARLHQAYQGELKPETHLLIGERSGLITLLIKELVTSFCQHGLRRCDVDKKLQQLESAMLHTNPIKAYLFPAIGFFRSTGAKQIGNIREAFNAKEFKI